MYTLADTAMQTPVHFLYGARITNLRDGTPVVLRPMRPGDVPFVLEMHDRVSAEALYFRYLHPYHPTVEEIDRLARMEEKEGAAFVAVTQEPVERVIGVALYCIEQENPTVAEPAFLVEDQFQGQGVGQALAQLMVGHASENGVRAFDALVHSANRKMMRLFEQSGLPFQAKFSYGAFEVHAILPGADSLNGMIG